MKKTRSKGFTLIELMVVISIIGLLSSVVVASLKSAREKAIIAKTVGEMKSLQGAIELHRLKYGAYPLAGQIYTDDESFGYVGETGFENFLAAPLVSEKFISNVPHAPGYPNNCNSDCNEKGYWLGYLSSTYDPILTCGKQAIPNYAIIFYANSKEINLPRLLWFDGINYRDYWSSQEEGTPPYVYCLSM